MDIHWKYNKNKAAPFLSSTETLMVAIILYCDAVLARWFKPPYVIGSIKIYYFIILRN